MVVLVGVSVAALKHALPISIAIAALLAGAAVRLLAEREPGQDPSSSNATSSS